MGIVDEDIARVRETSDIVAVITQYTQLKRVGRRFQGLCPFHTEKTGSFSVNAEDGLYYCFGCGQKGDAITFVREKEQLDFVGAVEYLANKAGIQLRYTTQNEGSDRKRQNKLQEIVGEAVEWYHERLLSDSEAGAARSYLRERGYDAELVKRFKLGWAPDDWDALSKKLKISSKDLIDSGLGFVNRRGRQQDFFRARILFPIFDARDKPVAFGGRIMPNATFDGPKYKNSSESLIYAKSKTLYGLNWAKADIVTFDRVVVCEGYTDVIGFNSSGMSQAVATCGTALTEEHVKLLKRFTNKVILAFDADAAGQNAALRFYEWEKTYDIDVAVADLPAGQDPGELSQQDPQRLVEAVDNAKPFLSFRIDRELRNSNLSSVEQRAKAAEKVLAMVQEHPDTLVRDSYAMEVASRLQLSEGLVRSQLKRSAGRISISSNANAKKLTAESYSPEVEALKLLAAGESDIGDYLVEELFSDETCAEAYRQLEENEDLHAAISKASPDVGELLHKVSVSSSDAPGLDVASLLWRPYLKQLMNASRLAGDSVSVDPATVEQHTWLRLRLEELGDSAKHPEVIPQLVSWIKLKE